MSRLHGHAFSMQSAHDLSTNPNLAFYKVWIVHKLGLSHTQTHTDLKMKIMWRWSQASHFLVCIFVVVDERSCGVCFTQHPFTAWYYQRDKEPAFIFNVRNVMHYEESKHRNTHLIKPCRKLLWYPWARVRSAVPRD